MFKEFNYLSTVLEPGDHENEFYSFNSHLFYIAKNFLTFNPFIKKEISTLTICIHIKKLKLVRYPNQTNNNGITK